MNLFLNYFHPGSYFLSLKIPNVLKNFHFYFKTCIAVGATSSKRALPTRHVVIAVSGLKTFDAFLRIGLRQF